MTQAYKEGHLQEWNVGGLGGLSGWTRCGISWTSRVGDVLSLRGQRMPEHQVKEGHNHRIDRWSGNFEPYIQFPIPVQPDRVRATYRNGVLEIRLPEVEEVKPRETKIELG